MHQIRLYRDVDIQATLLPNRFIDEYMPKAKGRASPSLGHGFSCRVVLIVGE